MCASASCCCEALSPVKCTGSAYGEAEELVCSVYGLNYGEVSQGSWKFSFNTLQRSYNSAIHLQSVSQLAICWRL